MTDQFLFGNFDKLPHVIALFLLQNLNYNIIFFSENLWFVYCLHNYHDNYVNSRQPVS